jgi:MoaA/NifB/PqqE/SkfB family radical SAM enzyme
MYAKILKKEHDSMPEIIVFEVTNRCNLDCRHCNKKINKIDDGDVCDLPVALLNVILKQAEAFKTRLVAITGGEPTTHRDFEQLIKCVASHDVDWTMTTNGINFGDIYPILIQNSARLKGITISIEGSTAETNDFLRGPGTFDKILNAMKLCRRHGISFGTQCAVGTKNVHDLEQLAALCDSNGADELNFILLRPTPQNVEEGLILTFEEAEAVEDRVIKMRDQHKRLKVSMATGYYSPQPIFCCLPLGMMMIGIDYRGNLRFCPDISNYRGAEDDTTDIVADLRMRPLQFALKDLASRISTFWHNKIDWTASRDLAAPDYYPCLYCLRHFNKYDCLEI